MSKHNKAVNHPQETTDREDSYGQYVEGNYGQAGFEPGRHAGDEDGQYIEGDYGRAGTEPGLHEQFGMHPGEGSGYVTARRRTTGAEPEVEGQHPAGRYTDADVERPRGKLEYRKKSTGK